MGICPVLGYSHCTMSSSSRDRRRSSGRGGAGAGFVVAVAASLCLTMPGAAHAYLDPASGSLFLQLLLGGVAGAALALKLYWRKVTGLFSRKSRTDEPAD